MSPRRDDDQLGLFGAAISADAPIDGALALQPQLPAVPDADDADALAEQEEEDAEDAARAADQLLGTLRGLGLQHVRSLVLTRNRSVVVSLKGFELRLQLSLDVVRIVAVVVVVRHVCLRK